MTNDITTFIQWWLNETIIMFQWIFNTLDNITFMGTSLLKVIIAINIIGIIITIFLSISKGIAMKTTNEGRIK